MLGLLADAAEAANIGVGDTLSGLVQLGVAGAVIYIVQRFLFHMREMRKVDDVRQSANLEMLERSLKLICDSFDKDCKRREETLRESSARSVVAMEAQAEQSGRVRDSLHAVNNTLQRIVFDTHFQGAGPLHPRRVEIKTDGKSGEVT